jgi:cation:H+ antiporter
MIEYILFVIGIILLIKSAEYLVDGASSLARKMGISTLVIGLTIVSLGTSLPELIVNIIAAFRGSADIAFGNIIGSNMSNTLLILGVIAIMSTLTFKKTTVLKEIPFSFLSVLFLLIIFVYSEIKNTGLNILSRQNGVFLVFFFFIFLYYIFKLVKRDKEFAKEIQATDLKEHSYAVVSMMIVGGLIGLFLGGKWTVDGAVEIASFFGLSEFLISATIIAVGTSLPELITCIVAILRKSSDLAVGNIIGSNIFNIFFVLGTTSIIKPLNLIKSGKTDLIILLFSTLLLFLFLFIGKRYKLERWQGIIFVLIYLLYIAFLIYRG